MRSSLFLMSWNRADSCQGYDMELSKAIEYLKNYNGRQLRLMEVCGTHTAAIRNSGLPSIISERIHLVSGPGCPVCVTVTGYIDKLIALSKESRNVIVTFGDLMRVPGSEMDLSRAKSEGADIRFVYSPLDMIRMAEEDRDHVYIFAAVGFETTTPVYAALISEAVKSGTGNIRLLTALKTMPEAIIKSAEGIDGFLAPGHVAVITGTKPYEELAGKLELPFVVSGFKEEGLAAAIYALVKMAQSGERRCLNLYPQAVREEGSVLAGAAIAKYFESGDAVWRGIGLIPGSGMYLKEEFQRLDAGSRGIDGNTETPGCMCAKVITGRIRPDECHLFGKTCTVDHPVGACMVSQEGACFVASSVSPGSLREKSVSCSGSKIH